MRIECAEFQAGDDIFGQQPLVGGPEILGKFGDEFVEYRPCERDCGPGFYQGFLELLGFVVIEPGQLADAGPAQGGHVHTGGHGADALVGADV